MIAIPAKGDRTRAKILDQAVELASVSGIQNLTIGPLAEQLGMSKSGLFAHFRSKEALQVDTLDRAAVRFTEAVISPLREEPDKSRRLALFFSRWLDWIENSGLGGGCPVLAAAVEFDDVPGPVRTTAAEHFGDLLDVIRRLVRAARPESDIDALASAVSGLALSHLIRVRLLGEKEARAVTQRAFDALLDTPNNKTETAP
jgi:AcrR family transcriptional regulator